MIPRVLKRLSNPNKTITLQRRTFVLNDALGNKKESWSDVKTLTGVIQRTKTEKKGVEGVYDTATHKGIFYLFEIENMHDYRVKEDHKNLDNSYYTVYYDIINYNPNLFIRGKTHHTEVLLRLIPSLD